MEKRLLMVFALATALSLPTVSQSADKSDQTPVQENSLMHDRQDRQDRHDQQDRQQNPDSQPVTQQERPAKTDLEQAQAPVILRMKIIQAAD